ncbi:MAG TPA: hypothetical protein VFS15_10370 [Kofleriaceae bacterium]|nr:hypothetical protein [Kofleriaceae bacterium]
MVARGAGDVGCAHCTRFGANTTCPICALQVCPDCAADWTTCNEPSGRIVRLGLTARLRDVDPTGRLGLVSHWRQPLRLFDLRRLRWIRGIELSRLLWLLARSAPPRLTGDGHLMHGEWEAGTGYERDEPTIFRGIRALSLAGDTSPLVECRGDAPQRGTAVTASGDVFYYVGATERVVALPRGAYKPWRLEPLPRKVIQAAHLAGEGDLLASASWCELALHDVAGGRITLIWRGKPDAIGDVRWIAVAGEWLAYAVITPGGGVHVEVRRLERGEPVGRVVHRHAASAFRAASLSRDGRYLALALDDHLLVHELGTDRVAQFREHTDRINLVRFAADHLLITADTDNRVVLRPRTPTGYARALVAIDVPAEGVELPAFATEP